MKKIIKNKVYDTDTATLIGSDSNGGTWRDFSHWEETLYRKRTGEYFVYGEGGPMTRYAVRVEQNGWVYGEKIIPMTYDSARAWAEEHLDSDSFELEFGAVKEDDSTTTLSISLPASVAERIRSDARQQGISVSALIAGKF